jgi:hypothetical protein
MRICTLCLQTLPFLKFAKPGGLSTLLVPDQLKLDTSKITDFIKTQVVPMIGANVFFFALAALFLLIFILWSVTGNQTAKFSWKLFAAVVC